jgi:predicted nucleic acid-binding protein
MRTAIDTNVISAVWTKEPGAGSVLQQLGVAKAAGALLIAPVVFAELLAYPGASEAFVHRFVEDTGIAVEFDLSQAVWVEAGRRFARHAERRRRNQGHPKRLLADFIIGSHALQQADRLMTLDPTRYKQDFPELNLLTG